MEYIDHDFNGFNLIRCSYSRHKNQHWMDGLSPKVFNFYHKKNCDYELLMHWFWEIVKTDAEYALKVWIKKKNSNKKIFSPKFDETDDWI